MEIIEELKELDLDENEIKVYLASLKLGNAKSDEIAKLSELIRTTTYSILQKLIQKGFISKILKNNINRFEALNPELLLELLEEKKRKISEIIPKLKSLQQSKIKNHNVTVFEGKEGIRSVMNDILTEENITIKSFGSISSFMKSSPYFSKEYFRKKKERNIKALSISFNIPENLIAKKTDKKHLRETRFVNLKPSNSACFLYQDKTALITYSLGEQRGVIIQDSEMKELLEYMFDALNREAKKL